MCQLQIRNVLFSNTKNVAISNTKNVPIANTKKCTFQIRKSSIFKKEGVIFKYENALISNTKMYHFQIQKMSLFQMGECSIAKYKKRTVFKYEKCGMYVFSNTNVTYFWNKRHSINGYV